MKPVSNLHYDTLIIGGGISGLFMASRLGKAGKKCLVLETGSREPIGDWRKLTWFDDQRDQVELHSDYPYKYEYSWVKTLGGSTEAWEGYTPRWTHYDFKTQSEFGVGRDWPIGYSDLEVFYESAESFLGVAGCDDNPFDEPRGRRFPLPPFEFDVYEKGVIDRVPWLEWHHVPQARNSRAYDGRSHCNVIGTCNSCPIQARYSPRATLVPLVEQLPNVDLKTDSHCTRIHHDEYNRATSADVVTNEHPWKVSFDQLLLCAGGVENARLLLLSTSDKNPNGFCNQSGWVGRGFMDHPVLRVSADADWKWKGQKQTNILASTHHFRRYNQEERTWGFLVNLNSRRKDRIWIAAHFEMPSLAHNRITLSDTLIDRYGNKCPRIDIQCNYDGFERTIQHCGDQLKRIASSCGGKTIEEDPFQIWACHPMGGTVIGSDPSNSVVNSDLRTWESENTYVLSNSVYCSGSAVNPTLTLLSLGFRLAKHLKC